MIIVLLLIVCSSCNNTIDNTSKNKIENQAQDLIKKNDTVQDNKQSSKTTIEYASKVIPEKTDYKNFKVAYLDFHKDWQIPDIPETSNEYGLIGLVDKIIYEKNDTLTAKKSTIIFRI